MKKYILILLSCLFLFGCEGVIDLEPENAETQTNYFKSEKDVANLVRAMYQRTRIAENISEREIFGWLGGEVKNTGTTTQYEEMLNMNFSYYMEGRCSSWGYLYSVNYNANFFLDNLYRVEKVTSDRLEFYKQHAYFGKAYTYFRLAQVWGEAPIVDHYLDLSPKAKNTTKELLEEAIKWGLKALDLPKFEEMRDEDGASITNKNWGSKGAVVALLAHIYAWRAAMDDNLEYWKESEKYCTMIIENQVGIYQLAADPKEVCKSVLKGNSTEGIWEISHVASIDNAYGNVNPYAIFGVLALPVNKKADLTKQAINLTTEELYKIYDDPADTLRLYNYFYGWGLGKKENPVDVLDTLLLDQQNNRYNRYGNTRFVHKWKQAYTKSPERAGDPEVYVTMDVNRVIWRLTDIILLRAETRMRGGLPGAEDDLNRIRQRAGINDYKASEGTLEYAIFKERKRELIYEGMYFFDVIRNGFVYLNGKSDYDYIRNELSPVFSALSDNDIRNGALYLPVGNEAFQRNSPMLQNVYWLSRY